jgi:hypothetical protein
LHPDDPLNDEQLAAFEQLILHEFRLRYSEALARAPEVAKARQRGDHLLAKGAVLAASQSFQPINAAGKDVVRSVFPPALLRGLAL